MILKLILRLQQHGFGRIHKSSQSPPPFSSLTFSPIVQNIDSSMFRIIFKEKSHHMSSKSLCERSKTSSEVGSPIIFQYLFFHIHMASLRLQKDPSFDQEEAESSESEVESATNRKGVKISGRVGRPRGKGRPKRSGKMMSKKKSQDEQEWEQKVYVRERAAPAKEESSVEGYIKIIDYLKKIDYDEQSLQNKMNPYNSLTATCFWYAISAEFYSYDFFSKKNAHDVALEMLQKLQKMPLSIPTRVIKTIYSPPMLQFQNEELSRLGEQIGERMSHMIPAPLAYRSELIERKISNSSVAEDDLFISSTRAILYNYITKKIHNSQKWGALFASFSKDIEELPQKQFIRPEVIEFVPEQKPAQEVNLFELLRQQAKKKVQKRQKNRIAKMAKDSDIFQEDQQEQGDKNIDQIKEEEAAYEVQPQAWGTKVVLKEQKCQINKEVQQDQQFQQIDKVELKEDIPEKKEEQQLAVQEINQNVKLEKQEDVHEEDIKEESLHQEAIKEEDIKQEEDRRWTKRYSQQDVILDSILHLPLDKVISILQSSLPSIQMPQIRQPLMPLPTKDPLDFVFRLHPQEQNYLQYMKEQRKKKYRLKALRGDNWVDDEEKQGQYEDAKCQICTDGDYTDDNLIVFCSMCNISLHQRCVGLAKVPAQSWVCQICLAFGPAGINLPCPLCDIKGGAMKRTSIHIDTNIFKQSNPGFHQFSKKCPYTKQKEEYGHKDKVEGEQGMKVEEGGSQELEKQREKEKEKVKIDQDGYYDYFVKSTYPSQLPSCHYVWVHYVCAIWVPECYFEQKNGVISVRGIQNIDHRRFKAECFVCHKNRSGASVKCQDSECNKYYHPECARKKKVYMQQLNLQKLKYLIFCQEHEPLKLTRQIEYKKKKSREQIIKFARMIEKYIETYRIAQFPFKLMKSTIPSHFIETSHRQERDHKERRVSTANSDEEFLKELISNLSKAKMMTVHLEKVSNGLKITNVETPSKRQIRKCLNRYDQFWNSIKNGDSNEQNFKRYERIMIQNQKLRQKLQMFLNGSLSIRGKGDKKEKRVGKKRGKNALAHVETLIDEEGGIFCVCKKPYEGQREMFQCEVCGQWYHFRCLGFLGTEQDAQGMDFSCMKCMKFEDRRKKEERMAKYATLFSPDSILYLYRPPTPDLLSEQEVEQKNYDDIMQEVKKNMTKESHHKKEKSDEPELKTKKESLKSKKESVQKQRLKKEQNEREELVKQVKQIDSIKQRKQVEQRVEKDKIEDPPVVQLKQEIKSDPKDQENIQEEISLKMQVEQNLKQQVEPVEIKQQEQANVEQPAQYVAVNPQMDVQEPHSNSLGEDEVIQ